jgi:DNA-binding transcriptional MerR regulator
MRPSEVAAMIGIAASTIRAWSVGEFKPYLSPTGQGGEGRARNLTEHDVRVLNLIATMKHEGARVEHIHGQLRALQANDWEELPPLPDAPVNVASVPMVPAAAADKALDAERRSLLREIARLEERIEALEGRLDDTSGELSEALQKLAAAERELEFWRSGRLKPDEKL